MYNAGRPILKFGESGICGPLEIKSYGIYYKDLQEQLAAIDDKYLRDGITFIDNNYNFYDTDQDIDVPNDELVDNGNADMNDVKKDKIVFIINFVVIF